MALNLKLQMRLSQQLIMTPQLQQAIKLLQLSRQELEELIDQALVENPVLEEDPPEAEPLESAPEPLAATEDAGDVIDTDHHAEADLDWQQYINSGSGVIAERPSRGDYDEPNLEATLSRAETLQEHLSWQLEMSRLSGLETETGELLIGNIDDDGYLTSSVQELLEARPELHERLLKAHKAGAFILPPAQPPEWDWLQAKHQTADAAEPAGKKKKAPPVFESEAVAAPAAPEGSRLKVKVEAALRVEAVLRHLQQFDPPGSGARTLQECLEIQLKALDLGESLAFRIVHQDLKLLENKDLRRVARRQKVELEEVLEAYKLIMSLEPKPGRPFARERAQHITPDVFIYKVHGEGPEGEDRVGQYRVVLNDAGIPRLRISGYYQRMAEREAASSNLTQEYIHEKIKAGNWLMKSIEQRQKTILRVTRSILKHQYEFFESGIHYLKPLVLKDVAEDIDVHESTVSRITTNKYVHSPQGIFELKFFFTSGIDQGQGEVISSKKIKDMIDKMISGEDAREPLTDIQIAERLSKDSNIKVARRTVAKYREALDLLPSNKRKQLF
ncbi:MAG TPA: RNA polymerase factor sigma-54 [bacterium]|nr:RNA polymerase factor sigma-54 [bacterium]